MEAKKSREKLFLSWVGGKQHSQFFISDFFVCFCGLDVIVVAQSSVVQKKTIFTTQMQLKCKSRDTHLNTQNKYVAWCWMHFCLKSQPMFFLFHLGVKLACLKSLLFKKHCFNYIRWPSIYFFQVSLINVSSEIKSYNTVDSCLLALRLVRCCEY